MSGRADTAPNVVVAEDNFLTAHLIVAALEQAGIHAVSGRDGDQVMRLVTQHDPRALVVNLNLTRPSGMELVRALRPRERQIRVIGFLAPGQADLRPVASALGVEVFFESPFDPDELVREVARLLEG